MSAGPAKPSPRTDPLVKLVGAAAFSKDAAELGPPDLIRLARTCGLLDDLLTDTDYATDTPRERTKGSWALALLGFAMSPIPDVRPWWKDSAAELWWECGFRQRPPYNTVYDRFVELQDRTGIDAFFEATVPLIRLAIAASGGLVGRDLHADGAEAETNARMLHDCQPGEGCPDEANNRRRKRPYRKDRPAGRMTTDEVKQRRAKAAEMLPEDEDAPLVGEVDEVQFDDLGHLKRIKCGEHWWRITDPTAGPRTYKGERGAVKSWVGFTHYKLTDHTVGEPLVVEVASASKQEYHVHPDAYAKLKYILDGVPRAVTGDKGIAIKDVYELHTADGVFTVAPWRGSNHEPLPLDRERYDRHGIPRCENCGGPTRFVSFQRTPKPRLFFTCSRQPFAECDGRQSTYCSVDPRFLLPLWRDTALYQALRAAGLEFERTHRFHRQRQAVGGNSFATRPKRKGREWQQLLVNAAQVATWLKVCWRNGWLPGSTNRVIAEPVTDSGTAKLDGFLERRRDRGLEGHYGARAAVLLRNAPWRLPQYRDADPLPTPPARLPGGPARRPLTALPEGAVLPGLKPTRTRDQSRAGKAARKATKAASSTESTATAVTTPTPGTPTRPVSVVERNRERARAARAADEAARAARRGKDPP